MHENANITFNRAESSTLMSSILALQPREGGGGGGKSSDEIVIDVIDDAEERMPALLDEDDKGPTQCINQIVATRLHGSIMTSTPSTRRQLDGVPLGVAQRSIWSARSHFRRVAPDSLVDLRTGHGLVETFYHEYVLVLGQRYGEGNSNWCWVVLPGNRLEAIHRERSFYFSVGLQGDHAVDPSRDARQDQDSRWQIGLPKRNAESRHTAKCHPAVDGRHL